MAIISKNDSPAQGKYNNSQLRYALVYVVITFVVLLILNLFCSEISKELFNELWDRATPLRLLGIALTNITREETMQFSLFQDDSREKSRKLDKAKDALNAKFGSATIVRGSSIQSKIDVGKKYKAQRELQNKKGE